MDRETLKAAILAKHKAVMEKAHNTYCDMDLLPPVQVYFYETGRHAGIAHGYSRVGYNLTVFAQDPNRFINDTVPHEIAHIICAFFEWDNGHGRDWKNVCKTLGGTANRCYDSDGIEHKMMRKRLQYQYKATCGTVIMVSDVMHRKIQDGDTRRLVKSKGILNRECYTGVCK